MLRYHVKVLLETKYVGIFFWNGNLLLGKYNVFDRIKYVWLAKNVIDLEYIRTVSSVARLKRTQCLLFSPRCGLYSERLQSTGELSGLLASCRIGSKGARALLFKRPMDDLHLGLHDLDSYWPYQYEWAWGQHDTST